MKKIEAIIRPEKVDDVRRSLDKAGYPGITITGVDGHGMQKGVERQWRGETYRVELLPKVKLEIVAADADVEKIIAAVTDTARTGAVGDGKIFVSPVFESLRIRTGERGETVL